MIVGVPGRAETGEGPVGVVAAGVAARVVAGVAVALVGVLALVQDQLEGEAIRTTTPRTDKLDMI